MREEYEAFAAEAREWLMNVDIPEVPQDPEERFDVLRAWQRQLFDGGWLGLSWPLESGGRGLTALHDAVFNRELAYARAPRPAGVVGIEVVGPTILNFGDEKQRQLLLPRVLSGDDIWCQGFSEPDAGSDLASLRTFAERTPEGWRVNGHKVWTTWSHKATWCALLARTNTSVNRHRGISYFLLRLDLPGITVRPLRQMNGDIEFGEVIFDNVLIEDNALVGQLNEGWSYAMHTLSSERGSSIIRRTADLSVALSELIVELTEGKTEISSNEITMLGELQAELFALEAQSERVAERVMRASGEPSALDSMDKASMTRFEQHLFGVARDLLGSYAHVAGQRPRGLNSTRWIHDYYFGRASSIYGGTAQIQRNIIAERLLGLPREAQ